jgi:hypothetical protein
VEQSAKCLTPVSLRDRPEVKGLYALEWGERTLILGGTSEIAGCAARESKHLTHCLPEYASLIRRSGAFSLEPPIDDLVR